MSETQKLIARIRAYAKKRGIEESTASRIFFGNGIRLAEIESGKSLRFDTFERVKSQLDQIESGKAA